MGHLPIGAEIAVQDINFYLKSDPFYSRKVEKVGDWGTSRRFGGGGAPAEGLRGGGVNNHILGLFCMPTCRKRVQNRAATAWGICL